MTKRLIKIAKELNVGTSTIVDYLAEKGFEIANRPTSLVTDEMYTELLKEFQNSMAVKEQADQLILGNRLSKSEEQKEVNKAMESPVRRVEPVKTPEPPKEVKKDEVVEIDPTPTVTTTPDDKERPKIKIVGKIDLNPKKPDTSKSEPEKKSSQTSSPEEPKVKGKPESDIEQPVVESPEVKETEKAASIEKPESQDSSKAPEEMIRAKTPQLKGLKILGKIDKSKIEKPKSKKKEAAKPNPNKAADDAKRKRKRTRKKITAGDIERDKRGLRKKVDDSKEISKKEIEDQIKATMARLSGGGKNKRQKMRRDKRDVIREKQEQDELDKVDSKLKVTEFISVSDLANLMNVSPTEVIMTCMNLGVIVSINQRLDAEIIEVVAEEFGFEIEFISAEEQVHELEDDDDGLEDDTPRAPIVTVMGHVDHGKTSLLDFIRKANVAGGEAGGITQHIGAYEVKVGKDNKKITFLDTPGHEAFTAMRARGAKITDIAVIIVAADDRIMPQTKEAISHAQAAGVPIVFAINKIDKDGADPERIKQELASMNLMVEAWGGKYQSQDISAKSGENIDLLLEKILLEAELLELKANPEKHAMGTVIEASLDKGRGYVTKLLIANGTLRIGDPVLAGEHSGKVKAMFNGRGKKIKESGPSSPVLLLGLSGAPQAGENFKVMESEQEARSIATKRAQILREQNTRASKRISLDEIGRRLALGTFKELNLIVKGDVDGSIEALSDSLIKLSQETVGVNVIHKAVGQIIESDVLLASASDAIIIGFQVRPSIGARQVAEREGVQIKTYSIIYEAIEEIKMAIEGMLEPTREEKVTGQVEVRETYKISKIGTIAGCYVLEGKITRNSLIRVVRDGIVVFPTKEGATGEISGLKRYKDDVKEVKHGTECGITVKNFNDIKVGDMIEAYEIIEIKQTLDMN
jgi:translation initiation factor IF-2